MPFEPVYGRIWLKVQYDRFRSLLAFLAQKDQVSVGDIKVTLIIRKPTWLRCKDSSNTN